jgi:hypothetical protein
MIALEPEASLRVEPGTRVELVCLSGVVWITQQGDPRDLFLAPGESLTLLSRGRTLVTALESSLVRVVDADAKPRTVRAWWARAERLRALWTRVRTRAVAVIGPRPPVTE